MRLFAVFNALLILLIVVGGCQTAVVDQTAFTPVLLQGEEVYQLNCQRCHHPQGQGYRRLFPNLASNQIVTGHDPIPMIQVVKNGRGAMPSFDEALTDEEIAAVLTYIRNSWGNEAEPISPQQVRNLGESEG
ncbi:MAG: cytochrome c [Anaerolinea sp.]|nr:cytochrome c [Anaerolinea sp.]